MIQNERALNAAVVIIDNRKTTGFLGVSVYLNHDTVESVDTVTENEVRVGFPINEQLANKFGDGTHIVSIKIDPLNGRIREIDGHRV